MNDPIGVLLVGTDSAVAETDTPMLETLDDRIDVRRATTLADGLDRIADGDIDCIVSSYELADGTGIELLEAVRSAHSDLPFVLCPVDGSDSLASEAIAAGVSDYFPRGLEADQLPVLADRVTNLVAQQRIQTLLQSRVDQPQAGTEVRGEDLSDRKLQPSFDVAVEQVMEQRASQQELEKARDLLKKTEHIADVGGWELDTDTMEVFWTDNLFEVFGVDDNEPPSLDEALALYHEEDRQIVEEAVEAALESGEPFDVEVRFRRPDGEVRWLHVQGTPAVEDGEVVTLRGAVQDVTERRTRERVLREMYDIISDRTQSFEQQVRALLELGRAEVSTRYGTLSEIQDGEYIFEVVAADDDSIQAGKVVPVDATNCEIVASEQETVVLGDIECDAPAETDRTGYTELGISCYLGAPVFQDDEVYGTFCFYDTEPREEQFSEWEQTLVDLMSRWASYELQRKQVNERLQGKNEQLEQFASIVSHDLRNPLNVIALRTDLAQQELDSDHLDAIEHATERMGTLIDDLLALAREGDAVNDREPVDIESIVEQSWRTVDTVDATLCIDTDQSVRADESRLKQMFENLFRNAVEHGGEDVTVTVDEFADGFYVGDDGPGIPDDEQESVLEAGYSTAQNGTGFGLSIVERIVDAHGWELSLTDSAAGGARFEIAAVRFIQE